MNDLFYKDELMGVLVHNEKKTIILPLTLVLIDGTIRFCFSTYMVKQQKKFISIKVLSR